MKRGARVRPNAAPTARTAASAIIDPTYDVAIVGGGFAGTMIAVNLTRLAPRPLRIAIFDRDGAFGYGVAYSATRDEHVLNVPAAQMGAFPEDPGGFATWLRAAGGPDAAGFVPRSAYGTYLRSLLDDAADEGIHRIARIALEIVDVRRTGDALALVARDGSLAGTARSVVLALGSLAADPPADGSDRYVADPWAFLRAPAFDADGETLLVGTGLTALDVILSFAADGTCRGTLVALSRSGRFPLPHAAPGQPIDPFADSTLPASAYETLRRLRAAVRARAHDPLAWRCIIDGTRPHVAELWSGWPERERRRFLRHVRALWETHRHRAPPASVDIKDALIARGRLRVLAGRFLEATAAGDAIVARYREHGTGLVHELRVARVINCRGAAAEYGTNQVPIIARPVERGELALDPLGMGLRALPDGRLLDAGGAVAPGLYAIGWPLRGVLYETTAVRELRQRAHALAAHLSA